MAESNKTNGILDQILENQANFVANAVEYTKKLTKDFPVAQESIDKGYKLYKDSVDSQKSILENSISNLEKTTKEMKNQSENTQNYFNQWFENQMNYAKNAFQFTNSNQQTQDWFSNWQNWMNQNQNMMNQNPWMNMMNGNPFNYSNQNMANDYINNWSNYTKQYFDMMNQAYGEWTKSFNNMTSAESFKGMKDMQSNLSKFFELWMPMFKSMQDKTFNNEMFMSMMDTQKFKTFVDGFFKFMPDGSQKMVEQMNVQFVNMMKQAAEAGLDNYEGMKSQFNQFQSNTANPFSNMMNMYSNWKQAFDNAISPLSKVINENESVKTVKDWNQIADQMMEFSIKNSELQYMIYQHATKAMDTLATKVATNLKEGKEIESIVKLYQEWLMIGDDVFTNLFQSDSYSKLMTEVSSIQLKIKSAIDGQMEKTLFANIPVATRTEMDEVYKNLYDLKKMYRNLEKMFESAKSQQSAASDPAPKASAKKK